jgi:hypothetical protein
MGAAYVKDSLPEPPDDGGSTSAVPGRFGIASISHMPAENNTQRLPIPVDFDCSASRHERS